jgi:hypothetical protein
LPANSLPVSAGNGEGSDDVAQHHRIAKSGNQLQRITGGSIGTGQALILT